MSLYLFCSNLTSEELTRDFENKLEGIDNDKATRESVVAEGEKEVKVILEILIKTKLKSVHRFMMPIRKAILLENVNAAEIWLKNTLLKIKALLWDVLIILTVKQLTLFLKEQIS